jgi:hypothetical protein
VGSTSIPPQLPTQNPEAPTFCIVFVLRVITSVILPIGIAVDLWPGLIATQAVEFGVTWLGFEPLRPNFFMRRIRKASQPATRYSLP